MKIKSVVSILLLSLVLHANITAQNGIKSTINYGKIYGLALNQDIKQALKELDLSTISSETDKKFKTAFENRFKYDNDKTNYFVKNDTTLNPLLRLYQDYWRKSLLDNKNNFDEYFAGRVIAFFNAENIKVRFTALEISMNTIDGVWKNYIESKGYHGVNGKTGSLYDFLVWKTEIDTTYNIGLIDNTVKVNVHFMDDFVSKGWEEYATLGRYYPGGWSTSSALWCIKKSYNLNSEDFTVSYLKHEGQHFADLKQFPELSSPDLEYRAKLIELSYSNKEIYNIILYFINNAKYDKNNAHPFANYCIVRDLSKIIFKNDFESDINKWKQIPSTNINTLAKKIYMQNTLSLKAKGKDVHNFIE